MDGPGFCGVRAVRVVLPGWRDVRRATIVWANGRIRLDPPAEQEIRGAGGPSGSELIDGARLWAIPGLIDVHVHLAWTDFDEADRAARPEDERHRLTDRAAFATLDAGVTSVRDAGGAGTDLVEASRRTAWGPRLQTSLRILDRPAAEEAGSLARAVEGVADAGAHWVKIAATAGVSDASDSTPALFAQAELRDGLHVAHERGLPVMVHAWGGDAATWALELGAASIEHGICLTEDQVRLGAERNAVLVPTMRVYELVAKRIASGRLPARLARGIGRALSEHSVSLRRARDAGMRIALGTDFGDTAEHGRNVEELAALIRSGLSPTEALQASTEIGGSLLTKAGGPECLGRIIDGAPADLVLLREDPRVLASRPGEWKDAVEAVVREGRVVGGRRSRTGPGRRASGRNECIRTTHI